MSHLLPHKKRAVALWMGLLVAFAAISQGAGYSLFTEDSNAGLFSAPAETFRPIHFKKVNRSRRVHLAPIVGSCQGLAKGDVLTLNLFDDAAYTARIDRIDTNINGTVSIRARLDNHSMGYLLISTTGNESMGSIRIPEKALRYRIQNHPGTNAHYLFEMGADGMEELEDSLPQIPPAYISLGAGQVGALDEQAADGPLDSANIDVMIVYTPAAMSWAGGANGIANVIAQAMEKAQLALDNSAVFLTMTLVHSSQTDYTESGDSATDLNRLTYSSGYMDPNGYMDEVHSWRYAYKADLVALFEKIDDTGGRAWVLANPPGSPNLGFSLIRIQQAASSYTLIHELGHNLGCHHRKDQLVQPGPGLYSYSAGWRWTGNDSGKYCSVMSYEEDGYDRVGYFSSPSILYQGVAAGDATDGDNARTMRESKHVVAAYRGPSGPLKINLSPQGAIDVGAQWRRVGTSAWYNSHDTEAYIPVGEYTVEFKSAPGWVRPADLPVLINENQLTETSGVYTKDPDIIIGAGTSTWEFPLGTYYHDARTQTIYLASEIGSARNIVGLGLYVATTPGQVMNNFTIRLKHTDLSVYGSLPNWESLDWTTVYQANQNIAATGWVQFNFITPFVYNGTRNLMVDISFNNSSYSSYGFCLYSSPGGARSVYNRVDSNYGDPLTWSARTPTPLTSINVPNIKLVTTGQYCQIADLDGTCGVDWQDVAIFASYWLRQDCGFPDWCGGADLSSTGEVDFADYEIFASHWLEGHITYPPYDIVPDGKINMEDLQVLMAQWLDVPGIPSADIAPEPADHFVDFEDFALLAAHWFEGI